MTPDGLLITLEPLGSSQFLSILRSFLDILSSCKGPKAGVKILVSSGGISTVTSSSSRLLCKLTLANPLCVMVAQIMKSQTATYGDYGLYCGILACSMMEKILSQDRVPHSLACDLIQYLGSTVTSLLYKDYLKISLNFNSLKELLSVVYPILLSKPACGLSKAELRTLSLNTVKAFLNTVGQDLGEVVVLDGGACEAQSTVFQGVLYPVFSESGVLEILKQKFTDKNCDIPLLLFNVMLTGNKENECRRDLGTVLVDTSVKFDVVECTLSILEEAIKLHIGIVACQKVVHGSIRMFLQRYNILLLERMGTELTRGLEKLSGASPISDVQKLSSSYIQSCLGHVTSVKLVKQSKKMFVLLENDRNVSTMLLSAPNEEACSELKVVTQQALRALHQIVLSPHVSPGAGCSEACLAVLLQFQAVNAQSTGPFRAEQLRLAVGWLQRTLFISAGFRQTAATSLLVDSVYYHLWLNKMHCSCGLVFACQVEGGGGRLIELNSFLGSDLLLPISDVFSGEPKIPLELHDDAILDVYSSKFNTLKLALESSLHMLSIGILVFKHPV